MIAWYIKYSDNTYRNNSTPEVNRDTLSPRPGGGQETDTSQSVASFWDTRTISRRIRYTGILTKLPNTINSTTASAEIQENPSRVNAAPIIPRMNNGIRRITRPMRRIIARTEIGPAEKKRIPSAHDQSPHIPGFVQTIAA